MQVWNLIFLENEYNFSTVMNFLLRCCILYVIYLNCCILCVYSFSFVNLEYWKNRNDFRLGYKLSISKYCSELERFSKFKLNEIFVYGNTYWLKHFGRLWWIYDVMKLMMIWLILNYFDDFIRMCALLV